MSTPDQDDAEYISEAAAARLLPVSPQTLMRMRQRGDVPRHWKTPGGRIRYRKCDILKFRDEKWCEGDPPEHEGN